MNDEAFYVEAVQRCAQACIHALVAADECAFMAEDFREYASDWSASAFYWAASWEWNKNYRSTYESEEI